METYSMDAPGSAGRGRWAVALGLGFFLVIFLKNAWVSEDAYILFRSIEQFVAGHGPRWNPHERVQVFTSPLWFWLLWLFRLVSHDVFLNAVVASALLTLGTAAVLRPVAGGNRAWLFLLLLLTCSRGFFDFTSSGLENPLGYFLVALYAYFYGQVYSPLPPGGDGDGTSASSPGGERTPAAARAIIRLFAVIAFIPVCRHDLATLFITPTLFLVIDRWRVLRFRTWAALGAAALLPLAAWSMFSLVYYGSMLPNTAYAKLGAGVPRAALLAQGRNYFLASFRYDTITFITLTAGLASALVIRTRHLRHLALGPVLNLFYVAMIGGDFMQGRFLSHAFLLAGVCLVLARQQGRQTRITGTLLTAALAVYAAVYPNVPIRTPLDFDNREMVFGVADERGHYFHCSSLRQYLFNNREEYFPLHRWSWEGLSLARSAERCAVKNTVGYFGYWAGVDKIIIDPLAVTDPLLARMRIPRAVHWRIGHFEREIPDGYLEGVRAGQNLIDAPDVSAFYARLALITQSEHLFAKERIRAIIELNLGRYDHLLRERWSSGAAE